MPLEDILAALRRESTEEVDRIAAERDAAVAEISNAARREAEQVEAEAAWARDARLATEADVVRNRAALHVERRLQDEREAVYQEILRRAGERLSRLHAEPPYRAILGALLDECLAALPDAEVIMATERDAGLVAELVAERGAAAQIERSLDGWGGIEARTASGAFVRNTLEQRLARAGPHLRRHVGDQVTELRGGR